MPDAADHKPIYESGEGPVIKGNKKNERKTRYDGKAGSGNGVLVGESFGINPLKSGKGALLGESKAFDRRDKIQDNFLEEEDELASSQGAISEESGELDPSLFR